MEKKIKIAIVDDSQISRNDVTTLLMEFETTLDNVKFEYSDFESGDKFLKSENCYDLVILDYEMDGTNGIDVAKSLENRSIRPYVFFVSGYDELDKPMQTAIQLDVTVGFGFKKDDKEEFNYQMNKVFDKIFNVTLIEFDHFIINSKTDNKTREDRVYYETKLDVKDISYIITTSKNVLIVNTSNKHFNIVSSLTKIKEKLPHTDFEYVSKSTIINFRYILSINATNVLLTTNEKIPLSLIYRDKFKKGYENYLLKGFKKL